MLDGHPIFWILAAAVLAPLLAEIPSGLKVPVVVLEVVLGIVIGPHVLHLVQFDGFVETMFTIGMGMTLFMGGINWISVKSKVARCPWQSAAGLCRCSWVSCS